MFLQTERLSLRRFIESDFADFCEYAADEEMCRMMGRDRITDAASARPTFDWLKDKEERGYAIVWKETGRVIGNLTVYDRFHLADSYPELQGCVGRSLSLSVSRQYQRRGIAFEALTAVIARLFAEGADYINYGYFPFNAASAGLCGKLGFSYLTTDRFQPEEGEEIVSIETILWKDTYLTTDRVTLRRFHEADFPAFCGYAMDADICRMTGWENMDDTDTARAIFDRMAAEENTYAVVLKENGRVIGNFSAAPLHPYLQHHPDLQGKSGRALSVALSKNCHHTGLATEVGRAVIDHLFRVEKVDFVNAGYFSYNIPSKGLQEKLGFHFLGTHPFRRGAEEVEVIENIIWKDEYFDPQP